MHRSNIRFEEGNIREMYLNADVIRCNVWVRRKANYDGCTQDLAGANVS